VPGKYYLIDGLKPSDLFSFEQSIAPIDAIVVLNCHYNVAYGRMKERQLKEHRPDAGTKKTTQLQLVISPLIKIN